MEEQQQNLEWNEIQPNIWKPEQEGDAIQGILIGKESDKGSYGSQAYIMEIKGEKQPTQALIWGCAVLDERMKYVNVGEMIKIEFNGSKINKKGQPVKIFKVYKGLVRNNLNCNQGV